VQAHFQVNLFFIFLLRAHHTKKSQHDETRMNTMFARIDFFSEKFFHEVHKIKTDFSLHLLPVNSESLVP
jgi:hypothetical protein